MLQAVTTRARRLTAAVVVLGATAALVAPTAAPADGGAGTGIYEPGIRAVFVGNPPKESEGNLRGQPKDVRLQMNASCRPTNPRVVFCRFHVFTRAGTATADDYIGLSTKQSLPPGEGTRTLPGGGVRIFGDTNYEPDETVQLVLYPEGLDANNNIVERGPESTMIVTIANDDLQPGMLVPLFPHPGFVCRPPGC